ncbi:hypothetical protein [Sodaliphilus sp.]|uniref:hypothetical protein n=1 Tax=Sodaliphilus sp. TaxID=2815818 RepID=UPI00389100C2
MRLNTISSLMLAASAMLVTTSCMSSINDDDGRKVPVRVFNFVEPLGGGKLELTKGITEFEFNYGKMLVSVDVNTLLAGTYNTPFATGPMAMTAGSDGYHFSTSTVQGARVKGFTGIYDSRVGALAYDFEVGDAYRVHTVNNLAYMFTTTTITSGSDTNKSDKMGFVFDLGTTGTVTLGLSSFGLDTSDAVPYLEYRGIPYTMVDGSGFVASIDKVEDTQHYVGCTITNVAATVEQYGRKATLTFDMDGRHVVMQGNMFGSNFNK